MPEPTTAMDKLTAAIIAVMKLAVAGLSKRIAALESQAVLPGPPGAVGPPGPEGQQGRDGRDGVPGALGATGARGLDGKDGTNGRDGLGFEDLDIAFDGERTVTLRFMRGDQIKEFPVVFHNAAIYRDVFKQGTSYARSDLVTWGGSMWIARQATSDKPGEGATQWQLVVKAGREGREGKAGRDGKDGKDLLKGLR